MENVLKRENKKLQDLAITETHIKAGMSYEEYRSLLEQLLLGGKTTGENQSSALVDYTRINVQRMNKLDKKVVLEEMLLMALRHLRSDWYWIVLTEAWCGDAAQNIPILSKIADASPRIQLKLLLRDEYPEIFNHYAHSRGASIPLLICLKQEDLSECGIWGPQPEPVQKMVMDYKTDSKETPEELMENIYCWYATDKGKTMQREMTGLIETWNQL